MEKSHGKLFSNADTIHILKSNNGKYGLVDNNISNKLFLYDPGCYSTALCKSSICNIDGEMGFLSYRGHKIEDLHNEDSALSVSYLLNFDKLPNKKELDIFLDKVINSNLRNNLNEIQQVLVNHKGIHIMSALSGITALFANKLDKSLSNLDIIANSVFLFSVIICFYYQNLHHKEFYICDKADSYEEFLLKSLFQEDKDKVTDLNIDIIKKIIILHAEHEQNASTSTVRAIRSTGANIYSCIAGGLSSLWGPKHGGANEQALSMLEGIHNEEDIRSCIARAKDHNSSFKLMGFGHRVYKNYDPRAIVMKDCYNKIKSVATNEEIDRLFLIANLLEKAVLNDEYFVSRKLYPNVDFYSGIILKAMGMPKNMFVGIFALSRINGWLAHIFEQDSDKETKIFRPRQVYLGK